MIEILTHHTSLESDKVRFFTLKFDNYLIATSKLGTVWLSHSRGGLTVVMIPFKTVTTTTVEGDKHLVSSSFLPGTDSVFQAEMWRRVGRTDRMTDRMTEAFPHITVWFFPPPIDVPIDTTSYYSCFLSGEWRTRVVITQRTPSDHTAPPPPAPLAYLFTQTPACLCCGCDTTIAAQFPHSRGQCEWGPYFTTVNSFFILLWTQIHTSEFVSLPH